MAKSKKFTVEGGRQIYMDGEPFISIGRQGDTMPTDADEITHVIAAYLNRKRYQPKYARVRRYEDAPPPYGDIMTVEKYKSWQMTAADGHGYWMKNGKMSNASCLRMPQQDATHVVWFNK